MQPMQLNLKEILNNPDLSKYIHYNEEFCVYILDNTEIPVTGISRSEENKPVGKFYVLSHSGAFIGEVQTNQYTKTGIIPHELIEEAVIRFSQNEGLNNSLYDAQEVPQRKSE